MEKRNIGLDFLKVIACFGVVVLHVTGMVPVAGSGYGVQTVLYYLAGVSVPVFFMVNGYLLLGKPTMSWRYATDKILNILIVVFLWNIVLFLEKLLVEKRVTDPFIAAFNNLIQGDYFWQFWFFGSLIAIYLILPVIHRIFRNLKWAAVLTGALVSLCFAADLMNIFRSQQGLPLLQSLIPQTFRLWTWLAYFTLGGLFAKKQVRELVVRYLSTPANWIVFVMTLAVISFYQYRMGVLYRDPRAECFYDNIFTFIYVSGLFTLLIRQNFDGRRNTAVTLVSGNVMGIYIVHVTILTLLTKYVFRVVTQLADVCLILVVFILALFISACIGKLPVVKKLISL